MKKLLSTMKNVVIRVVASMLGVLLLVIFTIATIVLLLCRGILGVMIWLPRLLSVAEWKKQELKQAAVEMRRTMISACQAALYEDNYPKGKKNG